MSGGTESGALTRSLGRELDHLKDVVAEIQKENRRLLSQYDGLVLLIQQQAKLFQETREHFSGIFQQSGWAKAHEFQGIVVRTMESLAQLLKSLSLEDASQSAQSIQERDLFDSFINYPGGDAGAGL